MKKTYDVVIVGAGTAGMACAIEAAEHGAKVAVIEKTDKIGGAMHWSGGHMSAGGTNLQKRKNISDSVEEHLEDILKINENTGDLDLIKLAVKEAPHTLNWLDDNGFPWAEDCPRIIFGHIPYTKARTQYGVNKAISILETIKPLWDKQVELNNIDCYLNTTFLDLDLHDGVYDTVICKAEKNEISLKGKNILLTAGGYGSNKDYFTQIQGNIPFVSSAYPASTGEVMKHMESLKAKVRMAEYHLPSVGGLELEPGSGRCNFNEAWAMVLTSVYRMPRDIYVNEDGHRFMAEDEPNADTRERIVVKQKGWRFWVIFDEVGLNAKDENGKHNPIIMFWDIDKIKREAEKNKAIFKANTLSELAQLIGLPKENLLATVNKYNVMVEEGIDPDFGRTYLKHKINAAPYFAVKVHASLLVTFGGLTVNDKLQVLDENKNPIPGLYAAGEILGLGATSGKAFCSGMAITPALSFGRILGRQFAK